MYLQKEEKIKLALDRAVMLLSEAEEILEKLAIGLIISLATLLVSFFTMPKIPIFIFFLLAAFTIGAVAQYANTLAIKKQIEQLQNKSS